MQSTRAAMLVLAAATLAGGCQSSYVVVTVDARPTVHGAASLAVTLGNAGMTTTDALQLAMFQFPVTFSIDATGRSGDLSITVDALDPNMLLVGEGSAIAPVASTTAQVVLDSADFVVNTVDTGDEELSGDFEANGLQLGATADGNWTVAFHDDCETPCDMDARRFDQDGNPLTTVVASGTNQFALSTTQADDTSELTVAATGSDTMAMWSFESADLTVQGVACQHVDEAGDELAAQQAIASDADAEVVSTTAIGDTGQFAAAWDAELASQVIRGIVVDTTCTQVGSSLATISSNGSNASDSAFRADVAANGSDLLYAWVESPSATETNDIHVRATDAANDLGSDVLLFPTGTTEVIQHVRVAAMADGFAVVVRWQSLGADSDPGRIELYKVNVAGALEFGPVLISGKTGSDFASVEAFGVATRSDGAIIVVWHACGANGDGQGCGVFGRLVRPTGVPVGDPFLLATTLIGDQTAPAAAALGSAFATAWTDASDTAPDVSGLAVRARVVDPPYDDATAVLGAPCDTASPCGDNLICLPGTDDVARCFETCDASAPPPQCPDGGTCTGGGCVF